MSSTAPDTDGLDLAEFCRQVEEHLTRVNQGHLVRIVGPAFDLVRQWAMDGVPLSIVRGGIDRKAERHRAGKSARPLRVEFCEHDVRDVYAQWRRAVGVSANPGPTAASESSGPPEEPRRAPLGRHLDRVLDRLGRVSGMVKLPDAFLAELSEILTALADVREQARRVRGDAREDLTGTLLRLDTRMLSSARQALGPDVVATLRRQSEAELSAYRSRLSADAWARSLDLGLDRLVRERLGLPNLDPHA